MATTASESWSRNSCDLCVVKICFLRPKNLSLALYCHEYEKGLESFHSHKGMGIFWNIHFWRMNVVKTLTLRIFSVKINSEKCFVSDFLFTLLQFLKNLALLTATPYLSSHYYVSTWSQFCTFIVRLMKLNRSMYSNE